MSADLPPLRAVYGTGGSHGHVPDKESLTLVIGNGGGSPTAERAHAVYLAVLLIGQRTPEEIIVLADYLQTGDTSTIVR